MIKKDIKFSIGRIPIKHTTGGTKIDVGLLDSIHVDKDTQKKNLPWIQVFTQGVRLTNSIIDWNTWNGCVVIDIDSDKYNKPIDVDEIILFVGETLKTYYGKNYYCLQQSHSYTGLHIIFYFDVEKNEDNFKACAKAAMLWTKEAFIKNGYEHFINTPDVLDDCSKRQAQAMYVSSNKIYWNEHFYEDYGRFDEIEDFIENPYIYKHKETEDEIKAIRESFKFTGKVTAKRKKLGYNDRMKLFFSLCKMLGNIEEAKIHYRNNIWKYIITDNDHTEHYYLYEQLDRWEKSVDKYTINDSFYASCDRLREYGYTFKKQFVPKEISLYEPNEVVNLNEDERLSDKKLPLKKDKINHIYAGCGVGKTYMSKQLGIYIDDLDFIFNGPKRVCVVVPLKSISKDSFSDVDNWVCIDGDIEDLDKRNIVRNSNRNICTTWESFVLYDMNTVQFDYVIVDEIHTLYMYDYRVSSITKFKNAIKNCNATYTIFMTGTPSYEVDEFDCYKIQVNKKDIEVPCEMVIYNDSYMGYIFNDIQNWVKESEDNYAVIFYDTVNYKIETDFNNYGLDGDIFNKNYVENTEYILENKKLKKQITAFSVYGQAGINIYIDENNEFPNRKVRIYIANDNGLGIIQYANRIRDKKRIDKVFVFYKNNKLNSDILEINDKIDIKEAKRKVEVLKSMKREFDIFRIDNDTFLKHNYGFNQSCIDWGLLELNEENYTNYSLINNIMKYEGQMQIIYNRLKQSYFNVTFNYLNKDVKRLRDSKMKSNYFAGQMSNFDEDMIKVTANDKIRLEVTNKFNKVVTGDLVQVIVRILNNLYVENDKNLENTIKEFKNIIRNIIINKNTIKKSDLNHIDLFYKLKTRWNTYYDRVFMKVMLNPDWDNKQLAAVFMRTKYNDTMTEDDWKNLLEETYQDITSIRKIVCDNANIFEKLYEEEPGENIKFDNDEILGRFISYLNFKHSIGKKSKNTKKCVVKGIEFDSQKDAMEYFKVTKQTIIRWLKSEK